jgi:hypothetical protein
MGMRGLLQRFGLNPVCEWTHLVDGPGSPRVTCAKPAVVMLTDPRCGHDTLACPDCVKIAGETRWWWCRVCETVTDVQDSPIGFQAWWPKSIRKAASR